MLRPFDVIMTWPNKWNFISWFITWITGGGPSHVRVYVKGLGIKDENGREFEHWEVTWPVCRFGFLEEFSKGYKIEYGRHSEMFYPLPKELEGKGIAEMKRLIGSYYDVGELGFSHFFDQIGLDHTDQSDPEIFVCSSGGEHIAMTLTFPFCPSDQLCSPQDIRKSKFYMKVEGGEEA